ncbi:MAG: thioredoxin family protein [SAR324 cluster bacterium]|nr:thioredoxin family protein [SAR324 cluster bacterium]
MKQLPEGLALFVKKACPTCVLIEPLVQRISDAGVPITVYSQDDPGFPAGFTGIIDDGSLEYSFHQNIETVPTLILTRGGNEVSRLAGWHREEWQSLTGLNGLGDDLPDYRPGCGALNVEPGKREALALLFGAIVLAARQIEVAPMVDEMETCHEKGWTDGLPVVPPTPQRVVAMLQGTRRQPDEIVGLIPPNNAPCSVEKACLNPLRTSLRFQNSKKTV